MDELKKIEENLRSLFKLDQYKIEFGTVLLDRDTGVRTVSVSLSGIEMGERIPIDTFSDYFLYQNVDIATWVLIAQRGVNSIRKDYYETIGRFLINLRFMENHQK